jgi:hypothetical protein
MFHDAKMVRKECSLRRSVMIREKKALKKRVEYAKSKLAEHINGSEKFSAANRLYIREKDLLAEKEGSKSTWIYPVPVSAVYNYTTQELKFSFEFKETDAEGSVVLPS